MGYKTKPFFCEPSKVDLEHVKSFLGISSDFLKIIPVFQFPFACLKENSLRIDGITFNNRKMPTILSLSTLNEIKVTYSSKVKATERIKIASSESAASLLRSLWSDKMEIQEEFNILLLNRANAVLGWFNVSKGGTSATIVDPKIIFSVALKCNAHGIILSHNHPSGNFQPSESDIALTSKLKNGGALLEIAILDHIIITSETYYSFADEGKL